MLSPQSSSFGAVLSSWPCQGKAWVPAQLFCGDYWPLHFLIPTCSVEVVWHAVWLLIGVIIFNCLTRFSFRLSAFNSKQEQNQKLWQNVIRTFVLRIRECSFATVAWRGSLLVAIWFIVQYTLRCRSLICLLLSFYSFNFNLIYFYFCLECSSFVVAL